MKKRRGGAALNFFKIGVVGVNQFKRKMDVEIFQSRKNLKAVRGHA